MRARAAWLLIPLSWAVSCGGRYLEPGEASYDVAGSTSAVGGSALAQAGRSSGGGSGKAAGGKGGAGASGGRGNVGVAGGCACDPIVCGPGYATVPEPGGCCFRCELDLTRCNEARDDYARFRQQLVEKYSSVGCRTAADCSVYSESNACVSSCGIVIPNLLLDDFDTNLTNYAQEICAAECPASLAPPCVPPQPVSCVAGVCR